MVKSQQETVWRSLPVEVRQLHGHLSWVVESVSCSTGGTDKALQGQDGLEHVKWLVNNSECHRSAEEIDDEDPEELERECNSQNPKYARLFAYQLNKAAKYVLKNDQDEALKQLKKLRDSLGELSGEHLRLFNVTEYFVDVLEWSIRKLEKDINNKLMKLAVVAVGDLDIELNVFQKRWNALQKDTKNQAVIMFIKSYLEKEIYRWNDEKWLEILLNVINLDPDYHVWYHHAYRCTRHVRRDFSFGNPHLKAPSLKEIELCNKTQDLAPCVLLTIFDTGLLLKDSLWMTVYEKTFTFKKDKITITIDPCTVDVAESFQKCIELFDKVGCLAEKHGLQEWLLRSMYQTADLLLHVNNNKENRACGLDRLLKLEKENPDNAYLHQKLGRIYQYGVIFEGKKFLRNIQKAQHRFRQALELRQRNHFFCLRDYIKLFNYLPQPQPTEEVLQLLTEALEAPGLIAEEYLSNVLMWRGGLVWVYNPEEKRHYKREACADWLNILENFPQQQENFIRYIWNSSFTKYIKNTAQSWKICTNELRQCLEKIKLDGNSSPITLQAVEVLLEEIRKNPRQFIRVKDAVVSKSDKAGIASTADRDSSSSGGDGMDNNAGRNENLRPSASNKPWLKKQAVKGLADQDDNWRVRK